MVFSSYKFILMFLPVTFLGYAIIRHFKFYTILKLWLIAASLFFYAQGSLDLMPLFILTVTLNYFIGIGILKSKQKSRVWTAKLLLALGLIENISLLGYYKYTNFLIYNINRVTGTDIVLQNIILPLGISFFTFQLISYLVDCYKRDTKVYFFIDYLMFITFFPHLIVGPILHHKDMIVQIENKETHVFNSRNLIFGLFIFSVGCAKKIMLADPLITYAQNFYNNLHPTGFFESWTAVFSYTFAYYFDFSGYGDMAIGLGLLFNIKLPVNFNSPYKSRNFADFWRRWNMTLSRFLNDYVFTIFYKFGDRQGKLFLSVLFTFFISGLWHGAGWHFIIWGIVNGIFVCMAYMMQLNHRKLPFALAWTLTFAGVLLTRVLFDSQSMSQAFHVYENIFGIGAQFQNLHAFLSQAYHFCLNNITIIFLLIICAIISFGLKNSQEMMEKSDTSWRYAAFAGVLLTLSLFRMGAVSNFLYFRF